MGEPKEAIEYFQKSFDMAGQDTEMIGVISNNMAMVLNDVGEDSLALHYYKQSLSIGEQMKDTSSIILSLNNLGTEYTRLKDFKKAEELYIKALELTGKIKDTESFGLTYDNIGMMWEDRGDYKKALVYYLKELEYEKKTGVKVYIGEALASVSRACLKLKNHQMALKYAMEAYNMSEQIQAAELKATAAQTLSESYEDLRQFDQSLKFMKIARSINDSINSINKAKTVSNLASNYELKKKEAEVKSLNLENQMDKTQLKLESRIRYGLTIFLIVVIALLGVTIYLYRDRKKANQMLTVWSRAVDQKNQELNNLNKVKDKIFSTIAHDVRSPLASVQGMLALIDVNALSEEELQKMAIELSARVNTTSSLLDNLLNWSRNQIATAKVNPVKTDIRTLANECIELYGNNAIEKNITLLNSIPDSSHIFADEEMIRITLRNLISNAIKFTPANGEVKIEASPKDDLLCISISDSGVGIPQEDLTKVFSFEAKSTPGTASEKGTGLGLILCKEFIEKNGGQIWVDSLHGEGSTFSFTAPLA
jgi:signal transduction histidine kinase